MITSLTIPTTFVGNGVATVGNYGFPIQFATDLQLAQIDNLGNLTYLTSGFTVQGVGDPSSANWTYTLLSPLTSGYTIYAYPAIPLNQNNQFSQQAGQVLQTTEKTFDRIIVMLGQLTYQLSLAFVVNPGTTPTPSVFYTQLANAVSAAQASATAAAASATNAAASATNAAASATNAAASAALCVPRNKLINGGFDVWQRGTSFSPSAQSYFADRWQVNFGGTGSTRTITRQTYSPGTQPFSKTGKYYMNYNQSVAGSGDTYSQIANYGEGVGTYAGQQVTMSIWLMSATALSNLNLYFSQFFGSGGSPSATVITNGPSFNVPGDSTWHQYSFTFTVPSIAGKTLGTNGNDCFACELQLPLNIVFSLNVDGFSLTPTPSVVPYNDPLPNETLAMCQRFYYQTSQQGSSGAYTWAGVGLATATNQVDVMVPLPVPMRASPTVTAIGLTTQMAMYGQISGYPSVLTSIGGQGYPTTTAQVRLTVTATTGQTGMFLCSNNVSPYTAILQFNADL